MRGDVYSLKQNRKAKGHEQQGRRYAIVMQESELLDMSTWLVVPTSGSAGPALYRPEVTVLGTTTRALCEQMTCVDPEIRLDKKIDQLPAGELAEVENALRLLLAL